MKKVILGLLVLSSTLFVSCKKSDLKLDTKSTDTVQVVTDSTKTVNDSVKVDTIK